MIVAMSKAVCWQPSPHAGARPEGTQIDLIVLHAISLPDGCFDPGPVHDFFLGRLDTRRDPGLAGLEGVRVSAHFVIDRRGGLTQFVACSDRAWHAGVSSWEGRENCNDFSIGIELIGDERVPFTGAQYRECARLCRSLMVRFPQITRSRIVGHQDVAPGRKWDPGRQWDWGHFHRSLSHIRHLLEDIR